MMTSILALVVGWTLSAFVIGAIVIGGNMRSIPDFLPLPSESPDLAGWPARSGVREDRVRWSGRSGLAACRKV